MRYHIYNKQDASRPVLTLPTKWLVIFVSGMICKHWEYFLAVDSTGPTAIYEWIKPHRTDGTTIVSGPQLINNEQDISKHPGVPKPMLNYDSIVSM